MGDNIKSKNKSIKIICLVVIVLVIVLLTLKIILKKKEGNTIANIRNYGYVVSDNNYIYYMCPSEDGKRIGINKIKKDLTGEVKTLIDGEWEITGLNILNGYLYFVTLQELEVEAQTEQQQIQVDNKIHRIKINGTKHEVINDNEFNDSCYEIYAIDDKVYYIGTDGCIYFMNLDGSKKTKVNNDASGFIGITDKYIFYNIAKKRDGEEEKYITYIMDRNGKNARPINGEKLYNISVVDDYIYYITKERYIHKIKIDGTEDTMLSDQTAYSMNVTEEGIFYLNYYKQEGKNVGVAVYRMDLNGENIKELKKLDEYSPSLGEVDDWLFYTDQKSGEGRIELLSKDGKRTFTLFSMKYLES